MATVTLKGTTFTFAVQEKPKFWDNYTLIVKIAVKNEFVHYETERHCNFFDVEDALFCMFRLLAGGYRKEQSLRLEGANAILHFNPDIEEGVELTREYLRSRNSTLAFNLLFYSERERNTLGGVYSFLIPKTALRLFADSIKTELQPYADVISKRRGKYMFVGVTPQGYKGCNYWYLDPEKKTEPNTFVWVKMGRAQTLQLVYVDNVRYFNDEDAPYSVDAVKRIERQATPADIQQAKNIWKE